MVLAHLLRHCHSTLPLTVIGCHYLGIYMIILLSLLSFSVKMTVSSWARWRTENVGGGAGGCEPLRSHTGCTACATQRSQPSVRCPIAHTDSPPLPASR